MAEALYALLREDSVHRLQLFEKYSRDEDARWTPDFHRRIELSESLCKTLDRIIAAGTRPAKIVECPANVKTPSRPDDARLRNRPSPIINRR